LYGHKAILASFLPAFETLVVKSMSRHVKTDTLDVITVDSEYDNQQIDESTVELFLHFLYTGTPETPPSYPQEPSKSPPTKFPPYWPFLATSKLPD
jgi:hypothetical protein